MTNSSALVFLGEALAGDERGVGDGTSLPRAVQSDLDNAGLCLRPDELAQLDQRRMESLARTGRVELGSGALPVIVEAFASSPYLEQDRLADQLGAIQDAFYELRDQLPSYVGDAQLAEALRRAFDEAAGDASALQEVWAADFSAPDIEDAWENDPWEELQ